jgi:hypothetical protein
MRRGLVLVLATIALTGCHEQWGSTTWAGAPASSDDQAAEANVRAVIPAIEAYFADNGTYEGATLAHLRGVYDPQLPEVLIVNADAHTYCVESTVDSASFFKDGPGADIFPGTCASSLAPPRPPQVATTDAETAVLQVVLLLEDYYAQHESYAGVEHAADINGVPLSQVRIHALKGGTAYCVEAPRQAPSAHFVGPNGPLAPGPC